jgi:hypothetical protein
LPSQPSINRGTLILLAPDAQDAAISAKNVFFVFQYNPEKLLHTFNQAASSLEGTNTSTDPIGTPIEFFNLTFELDSVDSDLPSQNKSSADLGLHPALALLELMMQSQLVDKQSYMPIVVFKWGTKRSLAVRFVGMSIEEKSFDFTLNPTRATVSLTLRVLDASEVGNNKGARSVCMNHQNVQATLVDAYKLQTGQSTLQSGSGVVAASGISASTAASSASSAASSSAKTKSKTIA